MTELMPASPTCPKCHGSGNLLVEVNDGGRFYDPCDCRYEDDWPFVRTVDDGWVVRTLTETDPLSDPLHEEDWA